MRYVYPAILTPLNDERNTILIEVPDLELLTEGFGKEDAVRMTQDAICLKCMSLEEKELEIPKPRKVPEIEIAKGTFAEAGKGYILLVEVDIEEYKQKAK